MQQRFWMIFVEGKQAPARKHDDILGARIEAERLILKEGKAAWILEAIWYGYAEEVTWEQTGEKREDIGYMRPAQRMYPLRDLSEPSIPISALRAEREWLEAQYQCECAIDNPRALDVVNFQAHRLKSQVDILSKFIERWGPRPFTPKDYPICDYPDCTSRSRTPDCLEVRTEDELRKWQHEPPYPRDPARDGLD